MTELIHVFYTNGFRYEIIAECYHDDECFLVVREKEAKRLPLVLTIDEVKATFNKISRLPLKYDIPYVLFCNIVAGAALFSMKRGMT